MGCCSSRNQNMQGEAKKSIISYLDSMNLNSFTCSDIKRLEAQIITEKVNKPTYELLAKGWTIQAPFELFAVKGIISKFHLKISLLIFSKDNYSNKQTLFFELIGKDKRNLMKFLEWRYRLFNERIPNEMGKLQYLDKNEIKDWVESHRLKSGLEIIPLFQQIDSDPRMISSLNILFI